LQLVVGNDTPFTFDFVFGRDSTQEEIYNDCVSPLVSAALEGYNGTILAYGQTGYAVTKMMVMVMMVVAVVVVVVLSGAGGGGGCCC